MVLRWTSLSRKALFFWPLAGVLLLTDCTTKVLAVEHLSQGSVPRQLVGSWLRLTLAYNQGAAMGLTLGPWSRLGFGLLALAALGVLFHMYRRTAPTAALRAAALALLVAGATGNLLDRIRSSHGVVDFIDIGVGSLRFWTFNLADTWITLGAVLLAAVLWRVPRAPQP
jgi:signal peptidase II